MSWEVFPGVSLCSALVGESQLLCPSPAAQKPRASGRFNSIYFCVFLLPESRHGAIIQALALLPWKAFNAISATALIFKGNKSSWLYSSAQCCVQ